MNINELLESKSISKYRLSKQSDIPYATLSDICAGKTELSKCSAETVYKLAKELDVTMEELVESSLVHRPSFELFKSNICHRLKELGDIDFLIEILSGSQIEDYFKKEWYPESLYLLAMVDYLSRINNIPLCDKYSSFREAKLKFVLYPSGILIMSAALKDPGIRRDAFEQSIPEFKRFNIVESEIRNVI